MINRPAAAPVVAPTPSVSVPAAAVADWLEETKTAPLDPLAALPDDNDTSPDVCEEPDVTKTAPLAAEDEMPVFKVNEPLLDLTLAPVRRATFPEVALADDADAEERVSAPLPEETLLPVVTEMKPPTAAVSAEVVAPPITTREPPLALFEEPLVKAIAPATLLSAAPTDKVMDPAAPLAEEPVLSCSEPLLPEPAAPDAKLMSPVLPNPDGPDKSRTAPVLPATVAVPVCKVTTPVPPLEELPL